MSDDGYRSGMGTTAEDVDDEKRRRVVVALAADRPNVTTLDELDRHDAAFVDKDADK